MSVASPSTTAAARRDGAAPGIDQILKYLSFLLVVVGVGIAGYLVYVHYRHTVSACVIAHGCETVQKSDYAKLAGVPVALIGLVGYVGILAALVYGRELGLGAAAGQAWIGFGFSAYLTYREIWTIHAICIWCVSSAICLTLLMLVTTTRFLRHEPTGPPSPA